jgi:hypothetical protein
MGKDIVLARSAEEAIRSRRVWEFPSGPYSRLWWAVKDRGDLFPLLYSVCSHAEGLEGDFQIGHSDLHAFLAEIDALVLDDHLKNDAPLKEALVHLREIALDGQERELGIFGHAD